MFFAVFFLRVSGRKIIWRKSCTKRKKGTWQILGLTEIKPIYTVKRNTLDVMRAYKNNSKIDSGIA